MQSWALQYWLYMERREQLDDAQATLELELQHYWYERWAQVYGGTGKSVLESENADASEVELPITDPRDLDKWVENLGAARTLNGAAADAMAPGLFGMAMPGDQGRRV